MLHLHLDFINNIDNSVLIHYYWDNFFPSYIINLHNLKELYSYPIQVHTNIAILFMTTNEQTHT
jgi:hypothetical protein